jgi:hypothetical protein
MRSRGSLGQWLKPLKDEDEATLMAIRFGLVKLRMGTFRGTERPEWWIGAKNVTDSVIRLLNHELVSAHDSLSGRLLRSQLYVMEDRLEEATREGKSPFDPN